MLVKYQIAVIIHPIYVNRIIDSVYEIYGCLSIGVLRFKRPHVIWGERP
jgi:hypothetical protein